ncbi:hypothetical protein JOD82_001928 [Paenibacillus sp. 1182]|uniref:hypothetical protein n=1 Tax=Paenibacillus sp. 1182 TaxID=2806565 RepID=UPI001AE24C5D|nr:hypothetical protein [Paenibacillus sp. 1182]MBP1308908.1 hypothetical protein [Paenibacillus sp. 1182]
MIVTKSMDTVKGYIEYAYAYKVGMFEEDTNDPDTQFESDTFSSLKEFLVKVSPDMIEEMRKNLGVDRVWISHVGFEATSNDGEVSSSLSMFDRRKNQSSIFEPSEKSSRGTVSVKLNNEDIESRLMENLQKVKRIIDNTLGEYAVKY